jgi:hypothetical protein
LGQSLAVKLFALGEAGARGAEHDRGVVKILPSGLARRLGGGVQEHVCGAVEDTSSSAEGRGFAGGRREIDFAGLVGTLVRGVEERDGADGAVTVLPASGVGGPAVAQGSQDADAGDDDAVGGGGWRW